MIGPRRGPVIANIELLLYLNYGSSATIIARVHPFPAEIPAAEARRADVVEVRVARKVAPLFGLASDIEPFHRSWVCDFTALTLAEIGRGAPSPDRSERSQLDSATARPDAQPSDGWRWSGRAVWSPRNGHVPGLLSNATLNRYGPNTKAGAVLAAANRLLRGSTAAIAAACRHLAGTRCAPEARLAVWAGLVLEVYRAQPALVVAAVQARQVQRSLSAHWGAQVDRGTATGVDAPCEIHPPGGATETATPDPAVSRWRPTRFELVDATLPELGLAADSAADGLGLMAVDALDDIASAWCHRLLAIGRPGRGVVWLTEDDSGSRRAHAMVRVGAVVAPFVASSLGAQDSGRLRDGKAGRGQANRGHRGQAPPSLPSLPEDRVLDDAPLSHRRAHLLAAHVVASYVRYRDELLLDWPELRRQTHDLIDDAVRRSERVLDADDPVRLQLSAYAAYLDVWDQLRGTPGQPASSGAAEVIDEAAVRRLTASQQRVAEAGRVGRLDPGAVAYLLEIGIVALREAATRAEDASEATGGLPSRAQVGAWWEEILRARGLDPTADLAGRIDALSDAQVFHLHHYAAWLASSRRLVDLKRALAVQERVAAVRAEVARRELVGYAAKSAAARAGHELAAEIATELALAYPQRQRRAREAALHAAVRHAHAVLVDPSTTELLLRAGGQPAALAAARTVARALCVAAGHGVAVPAEDAGMALRLLDSATATSQASDAADPVRAWRADLSRLAGPPSEGR